MRFNKRSGGWNVVDGDTEIARIDNSEMGGYIITDLCGRFMPPVDSFWPDGTDLDAVKAHIKERFQ